MFNGSDLANYAAARALASIVTLAIIVAAIAGLITWCLTR